ncbi:MAG TPA: heavy metal translocating P-type ATPase, partial [Clostridia bacterium]|nr:heavy metal translocating P-type ATPase [Clostridia bacterium]
MKIYNYKIEGLDCAMCADSIQRKLLTLNWVDSAIVNFTLAKVSISTSREDDIFGEVNDIVRRVESAAVISIIDDLNVSAKKSTTGFRDWFTWCFIIGAIIGTVGVLLEHFTTFYITALVLMCIGAALMLIRTAQRAWLKIARAHSIDENFLVSISVIGAIAIGEGMEGLMVIFLYQIGKFLEGAAVAKTRRDLDSLLKVKPSTVRIQTNHGTVEVAPSTVPIGSTIVVYAGDIVALDGEVISGSASLNMSSLTGESAPVTINVGEQIMSGSVNLDGVLTIRTTSNDNDSTITKIMNLVETAAERKAKTETLVSRAARYYTPAVIFIAIFVGLMFGFVGKIGVNNSIYKGMIFLVISCPCAIAISVPLSYFSGIGNASKKGILVKGSNYLDAVANLQAVVFDKT